MVEPLRHRQTKEAATDMFNLKQPRHISTLPNSYLNIAVPQTNVITIAVRPRRAVFQVMGTKRQILTTSAERPDASCPSPGSHRVRPHNPAARRRPDGLRKMALIHDLIYGKWN
jgi:hypothetical protein